MKVSNIFHAQLIYKFRTFLIGAANIPYAIKNGFRGSEVPVPADFKPILRFVACSDIHIHRDIPERAERFGQLIDDMYLYSDNVAYNKLDAILVAGDFADGGEDAEYEIFNSVIENHKRADTRLLCVMGNHEFIAYRKTDDSQSYAHYQKHIHAEVNTDTVINGYHFIGVSYDNGKEEFAKNALWLKERLDSVTKAEPDKPVFVFHHPHPRLTVYGSMDWGDTTLRKVLERYPQVVSFSGHSHYFPGDPRSVWQGSFTAVGCGSLKAFMGNLNYIEGDQDAPGFSGGAWLVECDAQGNILMKLYDIANRRFFDDIVYYIANPANPSARAYTWRKRKSMDTPVRFAEGAVLKTEKNAEGECILSIPEAKGYYKADDYKLKITDSCGRSVFQTTVISDYVRAVNGDVSVNIGKLPAGKYKAVVKAYSPFAKNGDRLTAEFNA